MAQQLIDAPAPPGNSRQYKRNTLSDSVSKYPISTYYQQPCPTCGRRLLIRVEHLGTQVSCSHCRCTLVAGDISHNQDTAGESGSSIMERADRLLTMLGTQASSKADESHVVNEVTRMLMATGRFRPGRVEVSASQGTVKLQGHVKSYFQKQMAQVAALQVMGTLRVVNEIIVG